MSSRKKHNIILIGHFKITLSFCIQQLLDVDIEDEGEIETSRQQHFLCNKIRMMFLFMKKKLRFLYKFAAFPNFDLNKAQVSFIQLS